MHAAKKISGFWNRYKLLFVCSSVYVGGCLLLFAPYRSGAAQSSRDPLEQFVGKRFALRVEAMLSPNGENLFIGASQKRLLSQGWDLIAAGTRVEIVKRSPSTPRSALDSGDVAYGLILGGPHGNACVRIFGLFDAPNAESGSLHQFSIDTRNVVALWNPETED